MVPLYKTTKFLTDELEHGLLGVLPFLRAEWTVLSLN